MRLVRFALENPYAILALTLALCLLGLAILPATQIDILPDFEKPVVVSFFSYPGLPTLDMEGSVTSRVERALTLAGGIEHQESRTLPGAAVLKVFFRPGTDPSSAMNDIVNLEASDMFHLPPGIEYPFTLRSEPANLPVVLAAISGEGLSETELYKIGYYAVRNKMGSLRGVQIPHPFGGKFRQMMVYVDPSRLRALDLSARDVSEALRDANLVLAAGTLKVGDTDFQIHPTNTLPTTEEIESVPIAVREGKPIFIRDVGRAVDDAAIQTNIVRVNGRRSVYCPLLREPGENTIAVVDRIYQGIATEIPKMKARGDIPEATDITLVSDQSIYIRTAMRNLLLEVGLGALLVGVVVLVFLRQWLATFAIIAVIVISILVGGLGFSFTGHTINVMTLGGVALAVGTVVDVGIVVVENIVRHARMGKRMQQAAQDGAAEVSLPVLAGTLTTLAVFVPVLFLSDMIQYLFEPLAAAATLTIGASYFIGMTVVPVFCARFVRTRFASPTEATDLDVLQRDPGYFARCLQWAIARRAWVIGASVGLAVAPMALVPFLGTELFPEVDAGTFEIRIKTLPGTRLEETERIVARMEQTIRQVIPAEEIDAIIANIGMPVGKGAGFSTILSSNSGPDTAYIMVNLTSSGRSTHVQTYIEHLRPLLWERFPKEQILFSSGGIVNLALSEGIPVPISIQVAAGKLNQGREAAQEIVEQVRKIPGTADVQIAQALSYPQIDVQIDRTRARLHGLGGLSQEAIAETVLTCLGSSVGYAPTIWIDPSSRTDFFMGVQYEDNTARTLEELRNIPLSIETESGPKTIPLSNVAELRRITIPGEITRYNITRVFDVYVNVSNRDVGSVAADVEATLAEMQFPSGVTTTLRGPVSTMQTGMRRLGLGMLVAALLVYLVLLAQFQSFVDPLLIMLAVPLGLSGVIVMLFLTGTTVNIQSLMGTLMMIGVAVNNSILLVAFAQQLVAAGYAPAQAAWLAARIRLKPILMTTLVLIAAMLPLAIPFAPGSEAMVPLAQALIGGMTVSTLLTLILIPCVYSYRAHPPAQVLEDSAHPDTPM